jgi:hypothetical protein
MGTQPIRERLYKGKYRNWIDLFTSIDDELRQMNATLKAIAEAQGITVPTPPPVVVEIPTPTPTPPVIPPVLPTGILEEILDRIRARLGIFDNYITEEKLTRKGKVSSSQPVMINLPKELGRPAKFGFITPDDGDITLRINNGQKIPLKTDEIFDLGDSHIIVNDLLIETTSSTDVSFRMVLI